MNKKNIYKDFLNNADLPVTTPPADAAWNDMRKKLESKKRRFAFWFFLFALTAIFMSGTWLIYHNSLNINVAVSQTAHKNNKKDSIKNQVLNSNLSRSSADTNKKYIAKKEMLSTKKIFITEKKSIKINYKQEENILSHSSTLKYIDTSFDKDAVTKRDSVTDNTQIVNQTKTPDNNKKDKPDIKDSSEDANDDNADIIIETGVEWFAPIALNNGSNYFTAPNTKSKPYRLLLPAVWMNFITQKSMFTLEINPFASALLPKKSFDVITTETQNGDTIFTKAQTKTLNKIFGFSAGLGYNYNVKGNWWLGGNLQGNWWHKAVYTENNNTIKKSVSNSFNNIYINSSKKYILNNTDWNNFSTFQPNLNIELLYRKNLWQAGFNVGLPVSPLSKNMGPKNTFNAQLFFRLKLWQYNKKKSD